MLNKDEAWRWFVAGAKAVSSTQGDDWSDEFERMWGTNAERATHLPGAQPSRFSTIEKYLVSRAAFREAAVRQFIESDPGAVERIGLAGEIIASLALSLSGHDLTQISEGLYIGDLVVSFCRTHFIVAQHVLQVELIEAKTLLRKQLELLARLHEISKGLHSAKTPHVKHLPYRIRILYDDYSGTAHSSKPDHMILLGRTHEDANTYTPLYPMFDRNACVAGQHLCLISLEFCDYLTRLYEECSIPYDVLLISSFRTELIAELAALQASDERDSSE
jgi:hypothetical protein